MRWKKGESGNLKGRPKGTLSQSSKVRELLLNHSDQLVETAVRLALEGDLAAVKMCLDRICPPLKPKDEYLGFESFKGGISKAAQRCMDLLAEGALSPNDAKQIIDLMMQHTKLEEIVDQQNSPLFKW